jgi:integrase
MAKTMKKPLHPDMEAFLRFKSAERKSIRTLQEYESLFRRFLKWNPDHDTGELDGSEGADLLIAFVNALGDIATNTTRKYYSMLGTYTSWLVARERLYADPAPSLPDVKRTKGSPKPIPELTFQRLVTAAPTPSDRLALLLMGRCGLRREELRGVRLRDFDLDGPIATVHIIGKGNKPADQPLLDVVRLATEAVLIERSDVREYLQYPIRTSNLPGQEGRLYHHPLKRLSENAQDNWWARMLLAADVPPKWTMHQLRHTAGTHFYTTSKDPQQTQLFMRHEKLDTTFEFYVQPSDEARRAALQAASAADLGLSVGGQS